MTLKTDMITDLATFFNTDEFAETVTYRGSAISASVIKGDDPSRQGDAQAATARLFVKVADVPSPAYRDTVVIGSETWRVISIIASDDAIHELIVETDRRVQI